MSLRTLIFAPGLQARAIRTSIVVGSVLALINHGDNILTGTLSSGAILKILLTYAVPYCVALYASVSTMKTMTTAATPEEEPKIH
ncbi:nitrate/nitrite transporter NrtS [Pseudomonadales bacterium]|nr:nitrate/nitrite transporter NrtS [Pseudomonadales bacterium]